MKSKEEDRMSVFLSIPCDCHESWQEWDKHHLLSTSDQSRETYGCIQISRHGF